MSQVIATTEAEQRNCKLEDLQKGIRTYVYMPVDEDGEPELDEIDQGDLREALQMSDAEYYLCRNCGADYHYWAEMKEHLSEDAQKGLWA